MNCNQQSKTWFPEFICLFFCCLVVFFALPLSFFLRCSTSCANRLRICAQKCMLWSMYFYQLVCIQQKKDSHAWRLLCLKHLPFNLTFLLANRFSARVYIQAYCFPFAATSRIYEFQVFDGKLHVRKSKNPYLLIES